MERYKKNLLIYLPGRAVSLLGSGAQTLAIPLLVLEQTKSATAMGIITAISMVPFMISAVVGGSLADKYNKKHIMVVADLLSGVIVGLMAVLQILGMLDIYTLGAFQVLASISAGIFSSASTSIVPGLFAKEKLKKVNAYKGAADNFAMTLSPIFGGIAYAFLGIKYIFIVNAASFIISAMFEYMLDYEHKAEETEDKKESMLGEFKGVLKFIKAKPAIMHLFVMVIATNFLDAPVSLVIFPYLFTQKMGATAAEYGLIQSALVGGLMLGNFLLATTLAKKGTKGVFRKSLYLQYISMLAISFISLPFTVSLYSKAGAQIIITAAVMILAMGAFNAICNTIVITNLQQLVPSNMLGKFFAVLTVIFEISNPLGVLVYGVLIDTMPVHYIFIGAAAILLAIVAVFIARASEESYSPSEIAIDEV